MKILVELSFKHLFGRKYLFLQKSKSKPPGEGNVLKFCQIISIIILFILSSLIYFAEKEGGRGQSWTFMESFWFGLMALTSVGNGEKKPNTVIGKVKEQELQRK